MRGLTSLEARTLHEREGWNEIPEKGVHPALQFLTYFWGPFAWMIEAAAAISAATGDWRDFVVIIVLLFVNAFVGFFAEYQAATAIRALKAHLPVRVRVKRDGKWCTLPSRAIVRTDIIHLRTGDIVPADVRILSHHTIEVDQSPLTGESSPVERKQNDLLYAGSILRRGEVEACVEAVGGKTYFGKTAELVERAKSASHLQRAIIRMGAFIFLFAALVIGILFIVGVEHELPWLDVLKFALILLLISIPVSLPTILSLNLTLGAHHLSKYKALVNKLSAVEELASMDMLCVNKTGMLTKKAGVQEHPRTDSKALIKKLRAMHIDVKMLTGDLLATAKKVAHALDIGENVISAGDIAHKKEIELEDVDGIAEVRPENKYNIISTLQAQGYVVGMTGDGVDDTPALKKADVGIAMPKATAAARAAAHVVLLASGLGVINDIVQESRRIFQRMKSFANYRISLTISILVFVATTIFAFDFYPVTPIMIVIIAALNDGAVLSIAYDHVDTVINPVRWRLSGFLQLSTYLGLSDVLSSMGLFLILYLYLHAPPEFIRTATYLKLSLSGHVLIFITRTRNWFFLSRPSLILFTAVFFTQVAASFIAAYGFLMAPLGWVWVGLIWAFSLLWMFFQDAVKKLYLLFVPRD